MTNPIARTRQRIAMKMVDYILGALGCWYLPEEAEEEEEEWGDIRICVWKAWRLVFGAR